MPDGTTNRNYLHMHVFRTAVNGEAGESVNVKEGETTTINFSTDFAATWVPRHLWLIAFVYNESGVLQVKRAAFKGDTTAAACAVGLGINFNVEGSGLLELLVDDAAPRRIVALA